ncbi:hypothetical protein H1C71_034465, partial [Ictidomys tridecemlineatus]
TLSLRSKERDAPFHNFSKSQSSQQSHSHLSCAGLYWMCWALLFEQLIGHSPEADHSVFPFLNPRHHLIVIEINLKYHAKAYPWQPPEEGHRDDAPVAAAEKAQALAIYQAKNVNLYLIALGLSVL